MESYADVGCVLAMDIDCEACKMKVMEVLSSIVGVYKVVIDAKGGLVKVTGEVDPNILLHAISRTGRHAKLVWAKLNHPQLNRRNSGYGYGYGFGGYGSSCGGFKHSATVPECSWSGRRYGYGYGYDDYYPSARRKFVSEHNWPFRGGSYFSGAMPGSRCGFFGF